MNAAECFQQGDLAGAIAAASETVRTKPTDTAARYLLCELLCFDGNLDRADKQLEAIAQMNPKAAVSVSLFRQLLRAEKARQQFFDDGRLPDFVAEPSEEMRLRLEASIAVRAGETATAAEMLARAIEMRQPRTGTCDGKEFDEFIDFDELTATVLEVLTSNGKYYWIPLERVTCVEFHPVERPRDVIWRGVQIKVEGGPEGEVHVPSLYPGTTRFDDMQLKLGRKTEWQGGQAPPVRGAGQRVFLVGETDRPMLEIGHVQFTPVAR